MEAIRQAICRLESIPATLRKGRDVEDAIIQLSSTVKLLELPVASANTFTRLAENLRGRLQPLYRISLPLTLNFAVAVLQFIHCSKLVSTISGRNSPNPWENLLISLFSGLLDLMDESSNKKSYENIAYALYPAICPLYFVSQSGSSLSFHGELLSMAYQTLTATVSSHPRNTATLREHYIDRKTLGVTILRTKDFLALESLLDLFGSLIPSSKGGKAKRSKFVEDVFDTSIFKNAGTRIHKLLEDISCSDWSVSSERIISVLAESDVSFPQPFEASALMLNDSSMNSFSPFYIDQNQFVINIDKDGSIETLAVPYSITKNIVVSTSTTAELVQVVVQLTQSPTLGNQPLFLPSSEGPTISWDVKKLSLISYDKALKSRHLNIEKSNSTKLSKVKPIELGFHTNQQDSLILSKKRLEQLSQSWAFPVSSQDAGGVEIIETSPLMPQTAEVITSEQRALVSRTAEPPTSAALNPNGGNLPHSRMDFPRIPITSYPTTPRPHYEDALQWISDDEDADVQFLPQKYKKRQLIESDNDTSEVDEDKSKKTITPNITPELLSKQQSFSSVTIPAKILTEKVPIKTTKSLTSDVNVTSDSINMDVTEDSPQRSKHELQEASSPLTARPYKRAKYGRKECKISPSSLSPSRIDFEEIPKLNNKMKVELKSPMKPKASRMNQKVKPQIKPRAASAKKRAVKIQQVNSNKETVPAKKSAQQEGDDLAIASLAIEDEENRHGTASRRSVRASTLRARGKGPQAMNDTLYASKKSRKAPWQDADFLEKNKILDTVFSPRSADLAVHSPMVVRLGVDAKSAKENLQLNRIVPNDLQEFIEMPATPDVVETIEDRENLIDSVNSRKSAEKAIIIDLTADSPPVFRKKVNKMTMPSHMCVCKTQRMHINPLYEELQESTKSTDHETNIVKTFPSRKAEITGGQTFVKALKTEGDMVKIEEVLQSPQVIATSNLMSGIEKAVLESVSMGDTKDQPTVNLIPKFNSLHRSNKIQIPPVKAFDAIDWERQTRKSASKNLRLGRNLQIRTNGKAAVDPMQRILEVVQQINEVVVNKIEDRFEKVNTSLSTGQRAMFEATENALQEMFHESAQHFNNLVDLEEKYAAHCTITTSGSHDYVKSSEQLVQCFKDVGRDHSCQSLSKKLPPTLFAKIPAIILNPAVKLQT